MSKLPKLYVNKYLKSDAGKIYNASVNYCKVIFFPIMQLPSGKVKYAWRLTHQPDRCLSGCFDSAKAALADAVLALN